MGRHTTVRIAAVLAMISVGCVGLKYATEGRDGGDAVVDASPDVSARDVSAPDVSAPDVTAPDGTAPDVTAPDGTAPDASPDVARDVALDVAPDAVDVDDVRDVPGDAVDASDRPDVTDVLDGADVADAMDAADVRDVIDVVDVVDATDGAVTDRDAASMRTDSAADSSLGCGSAVPCGGACALLCNAPPTSVQQQSCIGETSYGCGLIALAGGMFTFGGDPMALNGTIPVAGVTVGPLYVDRHEVSVARYRRFLTAMGGSLPGAMWTVAYPGATGTISVPYTTVAGYQPGAYTSTRSHCNWTATPGTGASSREMHPVNCITWSAAMAFCVWDAVGAGPGRLPTEAEWEWIARGFSIEPRLPAGRSFPWGEDIPTCSLANHSICMPPGTVPVDWPTTASPYGIFHLAGNVAEWTADVYAPSGDGRCWTGDQRNPLCVNPSMASLLRTDRGGSFMSDANGIRGAARASAAPTTEFDSIGFRCVRSL